MKRVAILAAACLSAGCAGPQRSSLEGEWTPVAVNDCSESGETVKITRSGLTFRAGRSALDLIRFSDIKTSGHQIDVEARFRKFPPDATDPWNPKDVLRFEVQGDTARIQGTVGDDGTVHPLSDASAVRILTMRRCG